MAATTTPHTTIHPKPNAANSYPKHAIRKRRAINDPFFQDGNMAVEQEAQNNSDTYFYVEIGEGTAEETATTAAPAIDTSYTTPPVSSTCTYVCEIRGCVFVSKNWTDYEEHYLNNHVHICSECLEDMQSRTRQHQQCFAAAYAHYTYPSQHLLDIHMEERHCAFFRLKNDKFQESGNDATISNRRIYSCLVEGCGDKFMNDEERCEHLKEVHGYPRWFRFHPTKTRFKKKKKIFATRSGVAYATNGSGHGKIEVDQIMTMQNSNYPSESHEKRQQQLKRTIRKQKQKEKRANVPCRFFRTREGCRHGDNCMFLHASKSASERDAEDGMDVDVDVLTGEMSRTKISIPSNLSFGRRRRR
eukprot:CAMPEP_0196823714 /NCGR_PEP_ID=MMETSP1362-20130617/88589_1 /TAXON_ID=163516 /ORGANISM="Leptocylindrus danicus, Strain CCMP1856" /LENGTH=358 /DNA_ID=CAMNT_0042203683 /DNA_START=11 /DNA_END=1087 /DNA_ORIENTATION=-